MTEVAMEYLEDMFKEVVKKLYGDQELESNGSLKIMQTMEPVVEKEEDSQSSLPAIQMSVVQNGYAPVVKAETLADFENAWISSDETLSWTDSSIASYNMTQKLFRCNDCECVGMLSRVAEHWLGTHANLRVFQCSQCPYASAWARCVRMHLTQQHNIAVENNGENFDALFKENPVLGEVTDYLERLRSKVESLQEEHEMQEVEQETEIELKDADVQMEAHMVSETQYEIEDETQVMQSEDQMSPQDSQIETEVITTDEEMELKPQETLITIQIPARVDTATSTSQLQLNNTGTVTGKRYNCSYCSYGTDRRDLYTRHENIHKEEKPFHCYVCQKQFNRADHVKKHFLRMHRDHTYENNKIKRDLSRLNNQVKQQFITVQKPALPEIKIPFTYPANIVPKITFVQQRPTVIEDGSSSLHAVHNQNNTVTLNNLNTVTLSTANNVTLSGPSLSTTTANPTVINLKKSGVIKEKRFSC
ncbi:zinc finger protein 454, partial [Diaphorina citri]|uniref:Zinc finger protein 454 n=1 Tax=Diaphorina citri TaxID=121845 RepID=A0A1S3DQC6_DIACI